MKINRELSGLLIVFNAAHAAVRPEGKNTVHSVNQSTMVQS